MRLYDEKDICPTDGCEKQQAIKGLCVNCYGSIHYHVKLKSKKDLRAWRMWLQLRLNRADYQIDWLGDLRKFWGGPS
jgi:hypothetical protein